jgi:hypothetical protein
MERIRSRYHILQKKLQTCSDRVKSIDLPPTELWMITGLYNDSVPIYDHFTFAVPKTSEAAQVPVRRIRGGESLEVMTRLSTKGLPSSPAREGHSVRGSSKLYSTLGGTSDAQFAGP